MEFAGGALTVAVEAGIAWVAIDRPERRNAINAAIWSALPAMARAVGGDERVRCVVLRGAGVEAFSAGADMSEFAETYRTEATTAAYNRLVRDGQAAVAALPKPVLAMIYGPCVGAGCGLALACDLRFAAADARLGITPARIGAAYSFGDTRQLVDLVGPARAKHVLFSGSLLPAEAALALGMVDFVHPGDELLAAVTAYAEVLCGLSQTSIRIAKTMIEAIRAGADAETPELAALHASAFAGADFAEGYRAFLEKRPPRFSAS